MLVIIMFIAITVFVVLNGINQSVKNEKGEKMLKEIKMEQLNKEIEELEAEMKEWNIDVKEEKEINFEKYENEILNKMEQAKQLNGIDVNFVYDFVSITYNKKAKEKKWKVNFVRYVGYSDKGLEVKKNQKSFASHKKAVEEAEKYQTIEYAMYNEDNKIVMEHCNDDKYKEAVKQFIIKHCPNALGIGF